MSAVAAARAVAVAVMFVDEQQCPCFLAGEVRGLAAEGAPRALDGFLQVKGRDFDLPSAGIQDGDLAGGYCSWSRRVVRTLTWVVFLRPLRVSVRMVKLTSLAVVSGSRSACGSPVSRRRRVRMPSDSCSMN
jgi:hypothetical protein